MAEPPGRRRNFQNLQKFLKNISKIALFQPIFNKILKTLLKHFARIYEKHKVLGGFDKILKMVEKLIRKFEFVAIFEKCVARNRTFRVKIILYNRFFRDRGRSLQRVPPCFTTKRDFLCKLLKEIYLNYLRTICKKSGVQRKDRDYDIEN